MQNDHIHADLAAVLADHADCDFTKRVPSGLQAVTPAQVRSLIAQAEKPVVIKFGKSFCGWTKKLNRALQTYVPKYQDRADFYEVDIPTHDEVREEYGLNTSPMMLLFVNGKEVDRSDAAEEHEVPPVFEKWFGAAS